MLIIRPPAGMTDSARLMIKNGARTLIAKMRSKLLRYRLVKRYLRSHRCVVHQNVQRPASQSFLKLPEQRVDVSFRAELSPYEKGLPTLLFNRIQCLVSSCFVAAVVDRNQNAISGQPLRNRAPNAAGASGDERSLSLKRVLHSSS